MRKWATQLFKYLICCYQTYSLRIQSTLQSVTGVILNNPMRLIFDAFEMTHSILLCRDSISELV